MSNQFASDDDEYIKILQELSNWIFCNVRRVHVPKQLVRISVARGAAWSAALAPAVKVGLTGQVRNQSARNRNQISIENLHLWGCNSNNRVWDLQNQPPIKDDLSVSTAKAKESHNNRKHLHTTVVVDYLRWDDHFLFQRLHSICATFLAILTRSVEGHIFQYAVYSIDVHQWRRKKESNV